MAGEQDKLYSVIPEGVMPGARYTTARRLAESGLTRLAGETIRRYHRKGLLPTSVQIEELILLGQEDVAFILNHDQLLQTGALKYNGPIPGTPSPIRGRKRLMDSPLIQ